MLRVVLKGGRPLGKYPHEMLHHIVSLTAQRANRVCASVLHIQEITTIPCPPDAACDRAIFPGLRKLWRICDWPC